jgi:hypothetical protein
VTGRESEVALAAQRTRKTVAGTLSLAGGTRDLVLRSPCSDKSLAFIIMPVIIGCQGQSLGFNIRLPSDSVGRPAAAAAAAAEGCESAVRRSDWQSRSGSDVTQAVRVTAPGQASPHWGSERARRASVVTVRSGLQVRCRIHWQTPRLGMLARGHRRSRGLACQAGACHTVPAVTAVPR